MKPGSVKHALDEIALSISSEEKNRQMLAKNQVDGHSRAIAETIDRIHMQLMAGNLSEGSAADGSLPSENTEQLGRLGSKYSEALLEFCGNPESNDGYASTYDVIIEEKDLPGIGKTSIKARLTAYAYGNHNPLDGADTKGFEVVVALCEDETAKLQEFDLNQHEYTATGEYPDYFTHQEPAGTVVVLDRQCLARTNMGDLLISEDFKNWVEVMLTIAKTPERVPDAYTPQAIEARVGRKISPFISD